MAFQAIKWGVDNHMGKQTILGNVLQMAVVATESPAPIGTIKPVMASNDFRALSADPMERQGKAVVIAAAVAIGAGG